MTGFIQLAILTAVFWRSASWGHGSWINARRWPGPTTHDWTIKGASCSGHDLSMISRCYECGCVHRSTIEELGWTQRAVKESKVSDYMTRRGFVPGKWLPARSTSCLCSLPTPRRPTHLNPLWTEAWGHQFYKGQGLGICHPFLLIKCPRRIEIYTKYSILAI